MTSLNQQHSTHYPEGRVDITGLLYGSVGLVLSFALMGVFKRADSWLFDRLQEPLFDGASPQLPPMLMILLCSAVFCYGIAYAVLDSAGLWRRLVLGVTAIVLTLAMVPAFAVWNIYFSPFMQLVGVFWSWFCVIIYTQHHRMPCDPVFIESGPSLSQPERGSSADEEIAESGEDNTVTSEEEAQENEKYKPRPDSPVVEKGAVPDTKNQGPKKTTGKPARNKRSKKRSKRR